MGIAAHLIYDLENRQSALNNNLLTMSKKPSWLVAAVQKYINDFAQRYGYKPSTGTKSSWRVISETLYKIINVILHWNNQPTWLLWYYFTTSAMQFFLTLIF